MERREGGPHAVVDVETTVVTVTRGLLVSIRPPGLVTLLSRRNGGNMNIDFPCQSYDRASIASARGSNVSRLDG